MGNEVNSSGLVGMQYRLTHDAKGRSVVPNITAETNLTPTEADIQRGMKMVENKSFDGMMDTFKSSKYWCDSQKNWQMKQRGSKAAADAELRSAGNGRQPASKPAGAPNLRQPRTVYVPGPPGEKLKAALAQDDPNRVGGRGVVEGEYAKVVTQ